MSEQIIVTKGLSKKYNMGEQTVTALNNVSIEIDKGDLVSVTGTSGSG